MRLVSLIVAFCVIGSHDGAPSDLHVYPGDLQPYPSGSSDALQKAWTTFKAHHGKAYDGLAEEYCHINIFKEKLKKIENHNYLYDMGLKSYKMGINQFSDLDHSEIVNHKGLKQTFRNISRRSSAYLLVNTVDIPKTVDWRRKGYVTPVKNQLACGSCWAFSATGSLEGQYFRKSGKLLSLSEQNLVDCSKNSGNEGCKGGLMDNAFGYIEENGGIDTEESYPYQGVALSCRYKAENNGVTVTGYMDIESGKEDALTNALATIGPISVGITAKESLFAYQGGIYEETNCTADGLNHGVLAVGYGSEDGQDYYIVKNSWGPFWGEAGYFRLARNKNNMCGIASLASFPLV